MDDTRRTSSWRFALILGITLFIAMVLTIVSLPEWAAHYRPDWVALVLIYWAIATPERVGPLVGFIVGLLMDVLLAQALGLYAMSFCVMVFIAQRLHLQVRMFPLWQQALTVVVIIAASKLLQAWVMGMLSGFVIQAHYWWPLGADLLLWPMLDIVLREVRRATRIY